MSERTGSEQMLASAIGRLGVWDGGLCFAPAADARAAAVDLEAAGFQAAWLHEGGRDAFTGAALLLAATSSLAVGTSIASIWNHEPDQMAAAARTLGEAFPGRFVLGIGVSHEGASSWRGQAYGRPYEDLTRYLDAIDNSGWGGPRPDPPVPRMIAALGPKMLDLARRRSRGAIPYLGPPQHTAMARKILGSSPVLAVHLAIVLDEPSDRARALARAHVQYYLPARNYRRNFLRCGFTQADLENGGSDRLVDALIAVGDADEVAAQVRAHLDAGADHVCVSPLVRAANEIPVDALQGLAVALQDVLRA